MSRGYIRLTHSKTGETYYFGWSSSCDAPSTAAMTREELVEQMDYEDISSSGAFWLIPNKFRDQRSTMPPDYLEPEALEETMFALEYHREKTKRRLKRLDERGTTYLDNHESGEQYVAFNRAGPKEGCVKPDTIIKNGLAKRS